MRDGLIARARRYGSSEGVGIAVDMFAVASSGKKSRDGGKHQPASATIDWGSLKIPYPGSCLIMTTKATFGLTGFTHPFLSSLIWMILDTL